MTRLCRNTTVVNPPGWAVARILNPAKGQDRPKCITAVADVRVWATFSVVLYEQKRAVTIGDDRMTIGDDTAPLIVTLYPA